MSTQPEAGPMPNIKEHLLYCDAPETAFRTVWKDGIDVNVPAHWIEDFCSRYGAVREAAGYARVLEWAVSRWKSEVENRPLENKNRRPLDDVWRQVVRFAGGDPDALLGPSHDAALRGEGK